MRDRAAAALLAVALASLSAAAGASAATPLFGVEAESAALG